MSDVGILPKVFGLHGLILPQVIGLQGILPQVIGLHGLILPQVIGLHWANTSTSDFLNTAASVWIILPQVMVDPRRHPSTSD